MLKIADIADNGTLTTETQFATPPLLGGTLRV